MYSSFPLQVIFVGLGVDGICVDKFFWQVVDAPEILAVIAKVPHLSEFLNSLYNCQYKSFFVAFCK
jgi:hypothetical protein